MTDHQFGRIWDGVIRSVGAVCCLTISASALYLALDAFTVMWYIRLFGLVVYLVYAYGLAMLAWRIGSK